ncbi:MAG: hypothetical protein A2Y33_01485 [Spirochaetes bacterium GWF1_51_8]|nr:MAG: hypothetical protein A2Y33_01485 [Spirochaetes bacterium GWF1_51_8]
MRIVLSLLLAFAVAANVYAGKVKSVKGDVKVMVGGKWQAVKVGAEISDGTAIMTGYGASIVVSYAAGEFKLQELSKATYTEKKKADLTKSGVNLDMGKVKVKYDKQAAQGKVGFTVQTPDGSASVRGTEELVSYFPDLGTSILVLVGEVSISNISGATGSLYGDQQSGFGGLGLDPNSEDVGNLLSDLSDGELDDEDVFDQLLQDLLQDIIHELPSLDDLLSKEPERL